MTRINVGLAGSYVKLLLSSWTTYMYVQFHGMVHVYQEIVKIHVGTNCAPLIADLFNFILLIEGLYVLPSRIQTL